MNKKKIIGIAKGVGRDLIMAMIVVVIVMLVLYAYCGIWPPMVVVESGSMQHSDDRSYVGVIDTGDMVFVKEVGDYDLKSYVDGEAVEYSTYGGFGDVVIYRPNGDETRTPIIHRLVVWVEPNATLAMPPVDGRIDYNNYTFDIPSLGIFGSIEDVILHDYGHKSRDVTIGLVELRSTYRVNTIPHAGFITMGDNNVPTYDQPGYELVKSEWVVGKAIGELPWFGLIKLSFTKLPEVNAPSNSWVNLFVLIFLVLFIPLFFDFGIPFLKKKRRGRREEGVLAKKGAAPLEKERERERDIGPPDVKDLPTDDTDVTESSRVARDSPPDVAATGGAENPPGMMAAPPPDDTATDETDSPGAVQDLPPDGSANGEAKGPVPDKDADSADDGDTSKIVGPDDTPTEEK